MGLAGQKLQKKEHAIIVHLDEFVIEYAVVQHIVTKNTENCLHMTKHIRKFIEQIGNKIKETDVLLALHENNQELLTSPETLASFEDWIQVMNRAIDEESKDNDSKLAGKNG